MKITGIILAKNEEKKIAKAIESLSWCDSVLVIDDESIDRTADIAKEHGATVIAHPLKGDFSAQRNFALSNVQTEWALFVDSDEIVPSPLAAEIKEVIKTRAYESYAIPRTDYFWDTELKHGETRSARDTGIIRLMKKNAGTWTGAVHETFISETPSGKLKNALHHYSHNTLAEFIEDVNIYSSLRAHELKKRGRKTSLPELIFVPFGKFIYTYFLRGGFRDGAAGFAYSFTMSFHSFLVRAKLFTSSL